LGSKLLGFSLFALVFTSFISLLFGKVTIVFGSNRLVEEFVLYPRMAVEVEALDCLFKTSQWLWLGKAES
jgi:hypothetical protein